MAASESNKASEGFCPENFILKKSIYSRCHTSTCTPSYNINYANMQHNEETMNFC